MTKNKGLHPWNGNLIPKTHSLITHEWMTILYAIYAALLVHTYIVVVSWLGDMQTFRLNFYVIHVLDFIINTVPCRVC